ncbi:hypothetical protein RHMOL_Rhmol04G0116800 [Rhododendron molle]|uniref:Uncharacterized protein n=1 Tax=Rhododendron molle TaxID=49168 RepID=A0ACC0P0L2_RHOML|nr:hypothetical protein RHMOL_Rhmol04G0116800 [Rhododendron molle]
MRYDSTKPKLVTADEIENGIRKLMENGGKSHTEGIKQNVKEMSKKSKIAIKNGASRIILLHTLSRMSVLTRHGNPWLCPVAVPHLVCEVGASVHRRFSGLVAAVGDGCGWFGDVGRRLGVGRGVLLLVVLGLRQWYWGLDIRVSF